MSKKRKEKKVKSYSSDSEELSRMLKVLAIVVIALAGFYLIFAIARGEISFSDKKEEKEVQIQNDKILAGNIFNRNKTEYYVLMYDFSASDADKYENLFQIAKSYGTAIYTVDLGSNFNSGYVTDDKSKINISSIETLKVVNGTLIYVQEGKGTSYKTDIKEIQKMLFNV